MIYGYIEMTIYEHTYEALTSNKKVLTSNIFKRKKLKTSNDVCIHINDNKLIHI